MSYHGARGPGNGSGAGRTPSLKAASVVLDAQTVWVLLILFFACMVGSAFGFGIGLVSMPLLALVLPVRTATPLVGMVGGTVSVGILAFHWREVDVRGVGRLVAAGALGVPVGLFLLKGAADTAMKLALAAVILLFAAYRLATPRFPLLRSDRSAFLFGFAGGILGGAYNTSGPPVIVYGQLRAWPRDTFRASLQGFFVPAGGFALLGHMAAGLWTAEVLRLYALQLPGLALAFAGGLFLRRVLPQERFDKAVYVLLLCVGALLAVRTLAALFAGAGPAP